MQLGGQPTPRAAQPVVGAFDVDAAGRLYLQLPLLRVPAACRYARVPVESTLTSQMIRPLASTLACNFFKIRAQVPSRCQRRNSPYALSHSPYRTGTSRHGAPFRVRHRIPPMSCRFVHFGGLPGFFPTGSNSSRTAHCAAVKSPRTTQRPSQKSCLVEPEAWCEAPAMHQTGSECDLCSSQNNFAS